MSSTTIASQHTPRAHRTPEKGMWARVRQAGKLQQNIVPVRISPPPSSASSSPPVLRVTDLARAWEMSEEELRSLMTRCAVRDVGGFVVVAEIKAALCREMQVPRT